MNIKTFFWVRIIYDTHGAEFKVKTIGLEHTKSIKFHCLRLMAKYISKAMGMTD